MNVNVENLEVKSLLEVRERTIAISHVGDISFFYIYLYIKRSNDFLSLLFFKKNNLKKQMK